MYLYQLHYSLSIWNPYLTLAAIDLTHLLLRNGCSRTSILRQSPQDLQGQRHCAAPRLSAEASRIIAAGSWTSRSRVQATSRRARRRGQGRSGEGDRLVEDAGEPFRTAGAGRSVFHSIGQSVGSSPLVAEAKFPADPGEVVAAYCLGRIEDRPVGVTLAGFGGGWVRLPHRRRPGRLPPSCSARPGWSLQVRRRNLPGLRQLKGAPDFHYAPNPVTESKMLPAGGGEAKKTTR